MVVDDNGDAAAFQNVEGADDIELGFKGHAARVHLKQRRARDSAGRERQPIDKYFAA